MITELICYKCKCSKCNHLWTTKGHDLPNACPKCRRVTWNDDFDFSKSPVSVPGPEPMPKVAEPIKDDVMAFIAKAQAKKGIESNVTITTGPEPLDEWNGWTKEEQTYDDQTGDMRTFRRHLKTGRVRWIESETALISV